MLNRDCENRELLVNEFVDELINGQCESYLFIGKNGTGKKYVLNKLKELLKNDMRIFEIIEDSLFENKKKITERIFSTEISFNFKTFFAISLSSSKDETTKINYIISKLKSILHKKNILIFATDFQDLSSECKAFVDILLKYKALIESKIKTKISIIITSNNDYFNGKYNIRNIIFKDYNLEDIKSYLIHNLAYKIDDVTSDFLHQIQAICGTNYNLINLYHKYIFSDGLKYCGSIDELIDKKIRCYIELGKIFNLSNEELLSTLLISSLTIGTFSKHMIAFIAQMDNKEKVSLCFRCAESEYFIRKTNAEAKNFFQHYEFLSDTIKKQLFKLAVIEYKESILSSYLYISKYNEDDYLKRFQCLYQYNVRMDDAIFSLVVLAVSKAFIINDLYSVDLIRNKLINMNGADKYAHNFDIIVDAYKLHYSKQYSKSNDKLCTLNLIDFPRIIVAEIKRLKFRNGQLGHCLQISEMRVLSEQLLLYAESGLYINSDYIVNKKYEKILVLSILYDLAPYALDTLNDKELFENIFDKSLVIVNQLKEENNDNVFAEYLINIFNRKAFLFRKPTLALLNYEEAERFFKNNHILDQYAMTLSSKSGILMSLKKYSDAILSCNVALKILEENDISIHGKEKIYNNLYIAQFLEYEQAHNFTECMSYAKSISKKLKKIIPSNKGGTKHVILTNLASFALYCKDMDLYFHYKKIIEDSLNCINVADVTDNSINDFYRYHFAWFDFYCFMQQEQWSKCSNIINMLDGFYPAIFKNEQKMTVRIETAKELVSMNHCPEPRDFCINFIKSVPAEKLDIDSRGLLLSDLQFTDWN